MSSSASGSVPNCGPGAFVAGPHAAEPREARERRDARASRGCRRCRRSSSAATGTGSPRWPPRCGCRRRPSRRPRGCVTIEVRKQKRKMPTHRDRSARARVQQQAAARRLSDGGQGPRRTAGRPAASSPPCAPSPSTSTPLSRWSERFARALASGSCVTITTVVPFSAQSRARISSTWSALTRSRSPVGSSQSRIDGSIAIARAIATRCSCPPESCFGRWSSRSERPTISSAWRACSRRLARESGVEQQRQLHVLERRQHRDQVERLEHEAHVPRAPRARARSSRAWRGPSPATSTVPAVGRVEPADQVQDRGLARARRPHQREEVRRRDLEVASRSGSRGPGRRAGRTCPRPPSRIIGLARARPWESPVLRRPSARASLVREREGQWPVPTRSPSTSVGRGREDHDLPARQPLEHHRGRALRRAEFRPPPAARVPLSSTNTTSCVPRFDDGRRGTVT